MKTGIKVFDAMTEQLIHVSPEDTIEKCAGVMNEKHVATVIIKKGEEVIGIISEQDIVRKIIAKKVNPLGKKVSEFMETKLITITANQDIFEALVVMRDANIRHLPVVDGSKIIGLLTLKDILKIEPQLFELLIDQMNIREEERKPINKAKATEGVCELCGEYTEKIIVKDNSRVCERCVDQL